MSVKAKANKKKKKTVSGNSVRKACEDIVECLKGEKQVADLDSYSYGYYSFIDAAGIAEAAALVYNDKYGEAVNVLMRYAEHYADEPES